MSTAPGDIKTKVEHWLVQLPYHQAINHSVYGPLARAALNQRYQDGPFNLPTVETGKRNFASIKFPGVDLITTSSEPEEEGYSPSGNHSERVGLRKAVGTALKNQYLVDKQVDMPYEYLATLLRKAQLAKVMPAPTSPVPVKDRIKFFSEREPCKGDSRKGCRATFLKLAEEFPIQYVYGTQNDDPYVHAEAERAASVKWLDDMGGFDPALVHPAWIAMGPHENSNDPRYVKHTTTGHPRVPSTLYDSSIPSDAEQHLYDKGTKSQDKYHSSIRHPASMYPFDYTLEGSPATIYPVPSRIEKEKAIRARIEAKAKAKGFDSPVPSKTLQPHFQPNLPSIVSKTINGYIYGKPLKKGGSVFPEHSKAMRYLIGKYGTK